jgi:hypothetical protein
VVIVVGPYARKVAHGVNGKRTGVWQVTENEVNRVFTLAALELPGSPRSVKIADIQVAQMAARFGVGGSSLCRAVLKPVLTIHLEPAQSDSISGNKLLAKSRLFC